MEKKKKKKGSKIEERKADIQKERKTERLKDQKRRKSKRTNKAQQIGKEKHPKKDRKHKTSAAARQHSQTISQAVTKRFSLTLV